MTTNQVDAPLCLAIGAGAIGKSVGGYVFRSLGCRVVFADVMQPVVADLQKRGGYVIHSSATDQGISSVPVEGVEAFLLDDPQVEQTAMDADFLCTAIGPKGLAAFAPRFCGWLKKRETANAKRLTVLLLENDADCKKNLLAAVQAEYGAVPSWLTVEKTSIERMTRPIESAPGVFDVVAETFIPVIVPESALRGTAAEGRSDLFQPVERVEPYYARKLYTNNLGHALLGYMGMQQGYTTTVEAMGDARIVAQLECVLDETCAMLEKVYGFSAKELSAHRAALLSRYRNQGLADSLQRLAKDPIRKIGRIERIVGAMDLCFSVGIRPKAVAFVLHCALGYTDPSDPSAVALQETLAAGGLEAVLMQYCGLRKDEEIYRMINASFCDHE